VFAKLLVANRGEIAVRIMRACRDLDIAPVAVYSDADAGATHTRFADEAYNVGPPPATDSYLRIDNIVDAARRSGADAVHPGYGFLAENAGLARAVIDAGLTWVGPSPEVIDAMGDKTSARRVAADAGVATVPGTIEAVDTADEIVAFASEHGWPVAIKAAAGGGGKGFRVVSGAGGVADALEGARREASAYFSSAHVYLERYLERPRHIEIQVVGDSSGAVLSFPERDCSLQRRHQKLIEESPSPALATAMREEIMEAARRVSKQVGYRSAGTCEFLLDADGKSFYFLEMNTRLQVEHPITELVCGVDLVEAQILIAAGERVPFSQEDIELRGHAIECRINAEDAAKGFMPAPGLIGAYAEPGGPGVRVDGAAEAGARISQAYDPLISKLITFGSDREQARRRMLRALDEYVVTGLETTIPFHRYMLAHDSFVSGDYHTSTVERELDLGELEGPSSLRPRRGDSASSLRPRRGDSASSLRPGAVPAEDAGESPVAARRFEVEVDGKRFVVRTRERLAERARRPRPRPPKAVDGLGGGGTEVLSAPMQGTIVKVLVAEGDSVRAGQIVCVLEAMKMENSILAHADGTVEELKVSAGQSVETGAALAIIR
jgi:acetyl-CoA/propionyl-CoA carboxylase, biotin carboxylase, biotin carboxyl carrier protein